MYCDLNVPWPQVNYKTPPTAKDIIILKHTLAMLEELEYTHVALNFTLGEGVKIPNDNICPINLKLFPEFENRLKIYTRITIIIDEPSQCQGLSKLQNSFDLVAACPRTEKGLQLACTNLEVDLISFNLGERLPCYLRHKTVGSAIEKGIKFEICYSSLISGPSGPIDNYSSGARRLFFGNCQQLIRASRSRGLIISSSATNPLQPRGVFDITNMLIVLGLDSSRAKSFVSSVPEKVLLAGRLRIKSSKQTITIENPMDNSKENSEKKSDANVYITKLDTASNRILKRQRLNK